MNKQIWRISFLWLLIMMLMSVSVSAKTYKGTINIEVGETYTVSHGYGSGYTVSGYWTKSDGNAFRITSSSSSTGGCTIVGDQVGTSTLNWTGVVSAGWDVWDEEYYWTVNVAAAPVKVTKIELNKSELTLIINNQEQLTATILPSNATNKSVTWSSNAENVATVSSSGNITAKSVGNAIITCKANDGSGVSASCSVTVKPIMVSSITLNKSTLYLQKGQEEDLTATVKPDNATDKNVTWTSSNPSIASVNSFGKVFAKDIGCATITCKANDGSGMQDTCMVIVRRRQGDIISSKTSEGIEMKFIVVDNSTCSVYGRQQSPTVDKTTSGSITIPSEVEGYNVTEICDWAFYNCEHITSINMPDCMRVIGEHAFAGCYSISSFTGISNIEYIDYGAFNNTPWYKQFPNGLLYIGKCLYEYKGTVPSNTTINVLEGTKGISSSAFRGYLTSIHLPKSISIIGPHPFIGCGYLTEISVASDNSYYDSRNNCNAIIEKQTNRLIAGCKTTIIPQTVVSIASYAFHQNASIYSIVIPNNVVSIEKDAFQSVSNLEKITIGSGIQEIGSHAFCDCNLKEIISISKYPSVINEDAFSDYSLQNPTRDKEAIYNDAILYVPKGCVTNYTETMGWNKFKNIVEICSINSITLSKTKLSIQIGQEEALMATIKPDNATDKSVTWSSNNTSVATIDSNGKVMAVSAGSATITCKANDGSGVQATCIVTVTAKPENISLPAEATVVAGKTITLTPTITPSDAVTTLTWTSDDKSIATVDANGVVTGVKKGQTFINVETDNGLEAYCKLTVTAPEPIKIELPKNATVYVGGTLTLTPTITPEDAETTLTWKSDDESIVQVNANGVLTGIAEGLALVRVSTSNGLTSNACKVKVEYDPSGISDVQSDRREIAHVFSLSGQRLAAPKKGVNIVGGKKVVVR